MVVYATIHSSRHAGQSTSSHAKHGFFRQPAVFPGNTPPCPVLRLIYRTHFWFSLGTQNSLLSFSLSAPRLGGSFSFAADRSLIPAMHSRKRQRGNLVPHSRRICVISAALLPLPADFCDTKTTTQRHAPVFPPTTMAAIFSTLSKLMNSVMLVPIHGKQLNLFSAHFLHRTWNFLYLAHST
jgi:hypothetical protein